MTTLKELKVEVDKAIKENTITPRDIGRFVATLAKVIKDSKDELEKEFSGVTRETMEKIDEALESISDQYQVMEQKLDTATKSQKKTFDAKIKECRKLLSDLEAVELSDGYTPVKGEDYFTLEEVADFVEQVKNAMPEISGEDIIKKINEAPIKEDSDENKIDYSRIKNAPKPGTGGNRGGKTMLTQMLDVEIPVDGLRNNDMLRFNGDSQTFKPTINLTVSDTEPTDPQEGDLWIDTA